MLKAEQLDKENKHLKQQLKTILNNAHENEEKLKRFEHVEFKLMEADTLAEVLDILLFDYPTLFKVNFSTLLLTDSELNIKSLLPKNQIKQNYLNKVSLLHLPIEIESINAFSKSIYLGNYHHNKHHHLVNITTENTATIKSIAILPLVRHEQIIGIFCCVSEQINRFEPCYGSDFMKHLSCTISVCIENVINNEKLKICSLTDPLTNIRNRRFFDQSLVKEVTHLQRANTPLSCLLLDIDHFKQVNDKYGHTAGDEVLIQVVNRIQTTLRSDEIIARYGGEEFVLLLPETDNAYALTVATRIIKEINKKPIAVENNKSLAITISIGLATLFTQVLFKNTSPSNNTTIHRYCKQLVDQADKALYQAKETGRNKVCNSGLIT
ncbi:MAG: GGDEF domain-containing protein [Pseudomonadota bacterium]